MRLPRFVFERAQVAVKEIFEYAHSPDWLRELRQKLTDPRLIAVFDMPATDSSVLMSYDFHYDFSTEQLSLIEINTNASQYLLTAELDERAAKRALETLRKSFFDEWSKINKTIIPPEWIAIVDENPTAQKTYFEFLMYKDLFRSWGVRDCSIYDINDLPVPELLIKNGFIYNRLTDFYLESPSSAKLWATWSQNQIALSTHPREYLLLADKARLVDFSLKSVSNVLIPCRHIGSFKTADEIWAERKKLFFKPRSSFGAKAVYRGSSISQKMFQEILTKDYIVQEYRPPGEWMGKKFDLRFFVYKSDIQLVCARLYSGQVTNFSNPGGGIALIEFSS